MAVSSPGGQTFRLRDLREAEVGRDKSELRPSSRRTQRFDESLKNKAGEVVGEFPAKYDKAPARFQAPKNLLVVAQKRQQTRSPVAALMAREGISTFTRLGVKIQTRREEMERDESEADTQKLSGRFWKPLADDAKLMKSVDRLMAEAGTSGSESDIVNSIQNIEDREQAILDKKNELKKLDGFMASVGGYSMLENSMKQNDARILQEAGKMDRSLARQNKNLKGKDVTMLDMVKNDMVLSHQLNLRYLALQEKLSNPSNDILSNILKVRSDAVKSAISGEG